MVKDTSRKAGSAYPRSLYFAGLWGILRAVILVLALMGQYQVQLTLFGMGSQGEDPGPFFQWLVTAYPVGFVTIAISILLLVVGIGLIFKQKWGRAGFLITSVIVLVWNLRAISWGRISVPLYSLVALGLAYWYFRQPSILRFFGAKDRSPAFLNRKIFKVTPDLLIPLVILAVMLILELAGLLQVMAYYR